MRKVKIVFQSNLLLSFYHMMCASNNFIIIVTWSVIFCFPSSQIFFIAWSRNCLLQLLVCGGIKKTQSMKCPGWRLKEKSMVSALLFKIMYVLWFLLCYVFCNEKLYVNWYDPIIPFSGLILQSHLDSPSKSWSLAL